MPFMGNRHFSIRDLLLLEEENSFTLEAELCYAWWEYGGHERGLKPSVLVYIQAYTGIV